MYTKKVQVEYSTVDTVYHEQENTVVNAINVTYAPRAMKRFDEYVRRSIMERIFSIVIGCIFLGGCLNSGSVAIKKTTKGKAAPII